MGRNATASGSLTPLQTYAAIVDYWLATNNSVVARGWSSVQMANIACDPGAATTDLHGLILANFAIDVPVASVVDLQPITVDGFQPFVLGAQNG